MTPPLWYILPTDTLFDESPDAGDPTCLCSRCKSVIEAGTVPVRAFTDDDCEYRFHPACVGMEVYIERHVEAHESDDDDDEQYGVDPETYRRESRETGETLLDLGVNA